MSLTAALSNAHSGLTATARSAQVVADNVANASTPGYGKRRVELAAMSPAAGSGGVRVAAVLRDVDRGLIADRRLAQADSAARDLIADASRRLERVIGTPGDGDSLGDLVDAFERALIAAESRSDLSVRLDAAARAGAAIAAKLNSISDAATALRQTADGDIDRQVTRLNGALVEVADLNHDIAIATAAGRDANALADRRQRVIDEIAGMVPVKELPRDHGQVALVSPGGAILLDGPPSRFGFDPSPVITPDMTLGGGGLSGLTLNGRDIPTDVGSAIGGGSLGAAFELRDRIAPGLGAEADAFARDLIDRFAAPGVDPTLSPGAPALFTDAGAAFDPANLTGLAGRIALNGLVDPTAGGNSALLRDGLGATAPGAPGASGQLTAHLGALTGAAAMAGGSYGAVAGSASAHAAALASVAATARLDAEASGGFAAALLAEFEAAERETGVDTDHEMQALLVVEQAFAANARVITAIGEMLRTLTEM